MVDLSLDFLVVEIVQLTVGSRAKKEFVFIMGLGSAWDNVFFEECKYFIKRIAE
jgi:hypothetical protein